MVAWVGHTRCTHLHDLRFIYSRIIYVILLERVWFACSSILLSDLLLVHWKAQVDFLNSKYFRMKYAKSFWRSEMILFMIYLTNRTSLSLQICVQVRPYKITYLILIHLFPKNRGGRRHFIFIFLPISTLERAAAIFSIYLVKGRYCARAIAIKFVEAACKDWNGRGWESSKLFYMAELHNIIMVPYQGIKCSFLT